MAFITVVQWVFSAIQWAVGLRVKQTVALGLLCIWLAIEVRKNLSSNAIKPCTNSVISSGVFHCLLSQSPLLEWDCSICYQHIIHLVILGINLPSSLAHCNSCHLSLSLSSPVDAVCCLHLTLSCMLLFASLSCTPWMECVFCLTMGSLLLDNLIICVGKQGVPLVKLPLWWLFLWQIIDSWEPQSLHLNFLQLWS